MVDEDRASAGAVRPQQTRCESVVRRLVVRDEAAVHHHGGALGDSDGACGVRGAGTRVVVVTDGARNEADRGRSAAHDDGCRAGVPPVAGVEEVRAVEDQFPVRLDEIGEGSSFDAFPVEDEGAFWFRALAHFQGCAFTDLQHRGPQCRIRREGHASRVLEDERALHLESPGHGVIPRLKDDRRRHRGIRGLDGGGELLEVRHRKGRRSLRRGRGKRMRRDWSGGQRFSRLGIESEKR